MILRTLISLSLMALLGVVLGFPLPRRRDAGCAKSKSKSRTKRGPGSWTPAGWRPTRHEPTRRELLVDVDLQSVVTHLEALDACAQAEVYPHMDGTLHIDVWQRRPVMRVHIDGGEDHYLDRDGERMALDPHHTPHLPVMHVTQADEAKMGLRFVNDTRGDAFWNNLTDQLSVNDQGEFVFHPRLAGQHIFLGDGTRGAQKAQPADVYRAQIGVAT